MNKFLVALFFIFSTSVHAAWNPPAGQVAGDLLYAKTATLSNYVKTSALNITLNAYARTATLNNYVKKTATGNYETAYSERLRWDGGSSSLVAVTGRTSLGLGNVDNTSDVNKPISTAQQTALNAKVTANAAITGGTKTKITYSSLGLVTSGTDATTADIADSTDRRYVTDAQRTVIQNTSGTNTGDQTITLTGDVTGTGTGSFATTIANDVVTNAKQANMANATIKGRTTSGTGDPEDLTASQTKTLLSLDNVENTALSTWAGSTNISTVGTLGQDLNVTGGGYFTGNGKDSTIINPFNMTASSGYAMGLFKGGENRIVSSATSTSNFGIVSNSRTSLTNTGNFTNFGLWAIPVIASSNTNSIATITSILGYAVRGSGSDFSTSGSNTLTAVSGRVGHEINLPITANSGTSIALRGLTECQKGSISNSYGINNIATVGNIVNSSGNIGTLYGFRSQLTVGATSGTGTGRVTNYYPIYIDTPTVQSTGTLTNEWGLYQQSPTAKNYFSGKVGIGVPTPSSYALDIAGTANATAFRTGSGTSTQWDTAYTDRLKWDGGATGLTAATGRTSLGLVIGTDVQAYDAELSALAGVTSVANKLPYFSGIGTAAVTDFTSNARSLLAQTSSANIRTIIGLGSVENTALSTWAGTTSITTLGTIATGTWSGTTIGVSKGGTGSTSFSSGAILYSNGSIVTQNSSNFMWNNTDKRVSIGRNDSSYPLGVRYTTASTTGVQDVAQFSANSSGTPDNEFGSRILFQVKAPNTNDYDVAAIAGITGPATSNSGELALYSRNSGTLSERMRINWFGQVGIGTTTPGHLLDVAGTTNVQSGVILAGTNGSCINYSSLLTTGTGTAAIFTVGGKLLPLTSSQRFKENIVTSNVDTSVIYNINLKTFNYKQEFSSDQSSQFGPIAEQVEDVAPELVNDDADGLPYSINNFRLINYLLAEIKKLNARITVLESAP